MIRKEDNPENSVLPFLISPLTEARGQEFNRKFIRKRRESVHKRIFRCKNQKTTS